MMETMKKISLLMMLCFATLMANAQTYSYEGLYYSKVTENNSTCLMVMATPKDEMPYSGNIVIPEYAEITEKGMDEIPYTVQLPVVRIDKEAFKGTSITSVKIGSNIERIGGSAFLNCANLQKAIFSNYYQFGIITFDNEYANPLATAKHLYVENDQEEIKDLILPDGSSNVFTSLSSFAFAGGENLESVSIPANIMTIGSRAFRNCNSLKKVTFESVDALCRVSFADKEANPLYYAHHLYVGNDDEELKTIKIPDGINTIGTATFAGASELTKVEISKDVRNIGNDAFTGCTKLTSVDFANMEALTTIKYGNSTSNPIYLAKTFTVNGKEEPAIEFSSDVRPYALAGATVITKVTLKPGVTIIGQGAFSECPNLKEVVNNANLEAIETDAFKTCPRLTTINLPNSLKRIGVGAFRDCISLKSVIIPSAVTFIGRESFLRCSSLTSAQIKATIDTIPSMMFQGCATLSEVTLSPSIKVIESAAFSGCSSLTQLPNGGQLSIINKEAFLNCKGITTITLPATITKIEEKAFAGCTALTDLIIPEEATSLQIGENAFASTPQSLNRIYSYTMKAPDAQPNSFGNATNDIHLYYKEGATGYDLVPWSEFQSANLSSKAITYYIDGEPCDTVEIVVGSDITPLIPAEREGWTFAGWQEWKDGVPALMPNDSLEIHGYYTTTQAIDTLNCPLTYQLRSDNKEAIVLANNDSYKNLTDIIIPDSITFEGNSYQVTAIDAYAFKNCKTHSVTIANSVNAIGAGAFALCQEITQITLPGTVTMIADSLFQGCSSLVGIQPSDNVKYIGKSAFDGCTSLNIDALPSQLEVLGDLAFCKCEGLGSLVLPKGIKEMGSNVFYHCTSLEKVTFDSELQLTELPQGTFQECTLLKEFSLSPAIKVIGANAFANCTSLKQVVLEDGITTIKENAFKGCAALQHITLPNTISTIGSRAFELCRQVIQITIYNPVPPFASSNVFNDTEVYANAELFVSDKAAYSQSSPWKNFKNISLLETHHVVYWVDGEFYHDEPMLVGEAITPLPAPTNEEGREFSGWGELPSVMPNENITAAGAFKYQFEYQNAEDESTIYTDSLFYGFILPDYKYDEEEVVSGILTRPGYRYEFINNVITMPANDTIIKVRYIPTETDLVHDGLKYHIYTEGKYPHADLMPGLPAYANKRYDIPDSITYLEKNYPVTTIRTDAFKGCTGLTSVSLPGTITTIGSQAFGDCYQLEEITLPKSITTIENEAFLRCFSLKNVYFENGSVIDSLAAGIFMDCETIEEIDLPQSLTVIERFAFSRCKKLRAITIPENVDTIGSRAFNACEALERIIIANQTKLPKAGNDTFDEEAYEKDTLVVSKGLKDILVEPWSKFNVEISGGATAEKCKTPKVYYERGTLRFECETEGADIKSEITVSDAIKTTGASSQVLNRKYIIKVYATATGYKRSDVKEASITWQDGKVADTQGFDGDVIHDDVDQPGVAGDMNGDGQVTAEDAAIILKNLVRKEGNNNEGK